MKLHRSHLEIILLLIANLTHGEFEVREKQQRTEQRQRRRREKKNGSTMEKCEVLKVEFRKRQRKIEYEWKKCVHFSIAR